MSQEEVMSPDTAMDAPDWFLTRFARKLNIRLAGCAGGLLLALLIAPQSRRLFLAQVGITVPTPATIASVAGSQLGINPDPFYGDLATPAAHAAARLHPDDLQMQIADACTLAPNKDEVYSQPPMIHSSPSDKKVQNLRALEGRFGDRPALYANILRYATSTPIRVQHEAEQCLLDGARMSEMSRHIKLSPAELAQEAALYAAYDRDAAQGERLDPDNAYFPFMRAVGLFGQHRDDEAIAAIARAAHKPLWREYYNDELRGQWKLQDAAFVNNSALSHALPAYSLLFPQYAQMRGAARVTLYRAMQAEQAGHSREGLALREDILHIGSVLRAQSGSLIGSLVGAALTDEAVARPGGIPAIRYNGSDNESVEQKNRVTRREQFDAYLERTGAADRVSTFHAAQQAADTTRATMGLEEIFRSFEGMLRTLLLWWAADILVLSSILWLLVAGGSAVLAARNPRIKAGLPLPATMRFALPLGLLGGALAAPLLLITVSPVFGHLSGDTRFFMLLAGLAPVPAVLFFPAKARSERLRRLTAFAYGLPVGAALTGFCAWQSRGLAGLITLSDVFFNLSDSRLAHGPALSSGLLWLTPCVLGLILLGIVTMSRACRVPLSVGLARGLRGLMVPVSVLLFLIYGVMLLFTIRAERSVQVNLEATLDNEGRVAAAPSGKP